MSRRRNNRQRWHQDTKTQWLKNIWVGAGGINPTSLRIGDRFIRGCEHDGIWRSKLGKGLVMPFLGSTLQTAIAPMITTRYSTTSNPVTNINFVSTDWIEYGENGGLNPGVSNSTKYLKCGLNPFLDIPDVNSAHLSAYLRTNGVANSGDVGCFTGGGARINVTSAFTNSVGYYQIWGESPTNPSGQLEKTSNASTANQLQTVVRQSSTALKAFRNSTDLGANLGSGGSPGVNIGSQPNAELLCFGQGNGSPTYWGLRITSHVSCGVGLSDTEITLYSNRVTEKEIALGRAV